MAKPKTKSFATQVFELNLQIQRIEKDPPIDDQIVIVDEMNILLTQVHSQTEKEIGLAYVHLQNTDNMFDLEEKGARVRRAFVTLKLAIMTRMRIICKDKLIGDSISMEPREHFRIITNGEMAFQDNAGNREYRMLRDSLNPGASNVPVINFVPIQQDQKPQRAGLGHIRLFGMGLGTIILILAGLAIIGTCLFFLFHDGKKDDAEKAKTEQVAPGPVAPAEEPAGEAIPPKVN